MTSDLTEKFSNNPVWMSIVNSLKNQNHDEKLEVYKSVKLYNDEIEDTHYKSCRNLFIHL